MKKNSISFTFLLVLLVLYGSCRKVQKYKPKKPSQTAIVSIKLLAPDSLNILEEMNEEM